MGVGLKSVGVLLAAFSLASRLTTVGLDKIVNVKNNFQKLQLLKQECSQDLAIYLKYVADYVNLGQLQDL